MKTSTVAKVALWFILFLALLGAGFEMVSKPSTIENVIGFFVVVAIVVISIKTKCLTSIKLQRKHEK
jgi:hypothetical protein